MRRPARQLSAIAAFRPPAPLFSLGLAALFACGSDSTSKATSTNTDTDNVVTHLNPTVSTIISLPVTLTPLPWDKSGSTLDPTYMSVRVGDPAPVFTDTTGNITSVVWTNTSTVAASDCTTDAQNVRTCSLTIPNIETKDYSIGMLVQVQDVRTSFSGPSWTSLATGVAQSTLTGLRGAAAGQVTPSPTFAMTSDGADQLGAWSGTAKVDLIQNGAMIGLIVDKNSQPVKGAQITIADQGLQPTYANQTFTGAGTPGPTATLPFFVVTPSSPKVVKSTGWTISAPAPATATWSVPLVGSAPNYLVMIPFLGK